MNVKKTSLHYRLLNWINSNRLWPKSLCAYLWALMWTLVTLPAQVFCKTMSNKFGWDRDIAEAFGLLTWFAVLGNVVALISGSEPLMESAVVATVAIFWIIAVCSFLGIAPKAFGATYAIFAKSRVGNIVISYIKTKRQSVCPLIDYVDSE